MLINNVNIPGNLNNPSTIIINGSDITSINTSKEEFVLKDPVSLVFTEAIAFPGLINSHDHLEFNLFPALRNRIYRDYVEWGNNIHIQNKEQINRILKIPYNLRFKWGLYKNLLCGVTSVVHHGDDEVLFYDSLPYIETRYNYIHAVRTEKHWGRRLNFTFNREPFVVHIGEGSNIESNKEIDKLLRWNFFSKKIIGVHGIALNERQSSRLRALVWCPVSNLFLYNKTADITSLKKNTIILFGTDSALSADWNIWNHIKTAREFHYLDDKELYSSLTENAAQIWGMESTGSIKPGNKADIVVSKRKSADDWESFYNTNPEDILLIVKGGKIVLIDSKYTKGQTGINPEDFDIVMINCEKKLVIKGIANLMKQILNYVDDYQFPVSIV